MKLEWLFRFWSIFFIGVFAGVPAFSMEKEHREATNACGYLEVECNIADESLYLCPESQYAVEERKTFFGLITNYRGVCSGEKIFLGKTPIQPVPVPAGEYVLLTPQGYVWEKEGTIRIRVIPGEKSYFLLKLFSIGPVYGADDHGGSGGGSGSGGAASGSGQ